MPEEKPTSLTAGLIRGLAQKLGQKNSGLVYPWAVLPYIPVSLGLVRLGLAPLIKTGEARQEKRDGFECYIFPAHEGGAPQPGPIQAAGCLACEANLGEDQAASGLCGLCQARLKRELAEQARLSPWPEEAFFEHALAFAAQDGAPFSPRDMAPRLDLPPRTTARRLGLLARSGAIRTRGPRFSLPRLDYPSAAHERNMVFIRSLAGAHRKKARPWPALGALAAAGLACLILVMAGLSPWPALGLFLIASAVVLLAAWGTKPKKGDS